MKLARWPALLLSFAAPAFAGMISPGEPFPAWTAVDQRGQPVSSADYAGRAYLLWFYPKAMTPG